MRSIGQPLLDEPNFTERAVWFAVFERRNRDLLTSADQRYPVGRVLKLEY